MKFTWDASQHYNENHKPKVIGKDERLSGKHGIIFTDTSEVLNVSY